MRYERQQTGRRHGRGRVAIWLGVIAMLVVSTACSNDSGESGTSSGATGGASGSTGGGTTVAVTLQEYAIIPNPASVPAGEVTFKVSNHGPDDVHEFVVLQTDLAVTALPTNPDGSANEEGDGITPVDEIEDIAVGSTQSLTVSLDAGAYVLICNIVDKVNGEKVSHYQQGMRAALTVS